jgi:hypothetical protein
MPTLHDYMDEYNQQVQKGIITKAYKGLMEYILALRTHLQKKYPDYNISNNLYAGYMDMTYFSLFPASLKDRKLKIALVYLHESGRFEAWLAAVNKEVQNQYWKLVKDSGWQKYHLVPTTQGYDSILEYVLVNSPDFRDLDALTNQIERGTLTFIQDLESFLSNQGNSL